jgi:putative intracellular protease/amidase
MKTVLVYVHDGLADWEASFVLPELKKAGFEIITVSNTRSPIKTMGGLKILPDLLVKEIGGKKIEALILPGGDSWTDSKLNSEILDIIPGLMQKKVYIAAICGAVAALARIGILDNIKHTSNYLPWLKAVSPSYQGDSLHTNSLAESEKGVITASGIGAMEFAYEVLKTLNIYSDEQANEWLNFYKNGVPPSWLNGNY